MVTLKVSATLSLNSITSLDLIILFHLSCGYFYFSTFFITYIIISKYLEWLCEKVTILRCQYRIFEEFQILMYKISSATTILEGIGNWNRKLENRARKKKKKKKKWNCFPTDRNIYRTETRMLYNSCQTAFRNSASMLPSLLFTKCLIRRQYAGNNSGTRPQSTCIFGRDESERENR